MNRVFRCGQSKICFDDNIFINIVKEHLKKNVTETGGIILGNYSDDLYTALINEAEEPTSDSKHGRTTFVRGIKGLTQKLITKWKVNSYYLGEWHLHPHSSPDASQQDITQILENSRNPNLKCPEPIMIIVGMDTIGEFRFNVYAVLQNKIIRFS